jgi:ABC-2 type transport system ATP-binding protein
VTTVAALHGVWRRFGRRTALRDASAEFASTEIAGLVGPNGAGKTTALRILAGVLRPSAGRVELPPPDVVSYFAGEQTLPPDVSARRWLWACARGAAHSSARRFGVLSRGMRQRIGLEAALDNPRTELLVLDEPWESLDIDAARWLSDHLIRKTTAGAAVVVSSHRIHELALVCDRCHFVAGGTLVHTVTCSREMPHGARVAALLEAFDRLRGDARAAKEAAS